MIGRCRALVGALVLGLLSVFLLSATLSCRSETPGRQSDEAATLTDEEKEAWDATAIFLTGVFTVANTESLDSTVFFENFRANYDWIKNVFLPHLRGTPEHPWWECEPYCVETARKLAKGDEDKEEELAETLSRYELHERDRPRTPDPGR